MVPHRLVFSFMDLLVALDIGTSSIRAIAFTKTGEVRALASRSVPLMFPSPNFVEQDPNAVLGACLSVLAELEAMLGNDSTRVATIGIANQRESVVAWDRKNNEILYPIISWQDGRTAEQCANLDTNGVRLNLRDKTGLQLDPYFSASKISWITQMGHLNGSSLPAVSTLDAFIAWHLMGANADSPFVTDISNSSRTLLLNLDSCDYDSELLGLFNIDRNLLAQIVPTSGKLERKISAGLPFANTYIGALAGDQQASLFGNNCIEIGATKATHGTGTFVLTNTGTSRTRPESEVLESIAWQIGDRKPVYCLEGSVFSTGSALRWLRDNLEVLNDYSTIDDLMSNTKTSNGVVFIPAFNGLATPYWTRSLKASIFGISSTTTTNQIVRGAIEGIVIRTEEVIEAIETHLRFPIEVLNIDGGLAQSNFICQLQADQVRKRVIRTDNVEATAFGAALFAGIALDLIDPENPRPETTTTEYFEPKGSLSASKSRRDLWKRYLSRVVFTDNSVRL